MCWGCVLHVSTPLSSTTPVWTFRVWSCKGGRCKGMWVHVSLQWRACYIQTLCEWCHMLSLWMLCHQLRPSWVAKSNGELYIVTCRLPLFAGTHEPSFIVTLNVNMASFWLEPLSLCTCIFPKSCELTNHTAIPLKYCILPLKMATQYPQFQFTVQCPFIGSNITAWGLSPVHSCLPPTHTVEAAHRAGEEEGRYNPHIVKLAPGNPYPRTQAVNPVFVTWSTKGLVLIISCTDVPGC